VQSQLALPIAPAGPADAEALARVHVQSWRETYAGILPQPYLDRMSVAVHARRWRVRLTRTDEVTLVADSGDGLVGYCSGEWARERVDGEAEISTLYLLQGAQGLGIGRRLLTQTARALAARGARALKIRVLRDNPTARGFYEYLGGRCADERGELVAGRLTPAVAYRWPDLNAFLAG
jgi:ribosomal protein S18 acetylase RimI-like enzyme